MEKHLIWNQQKPKQETVTVIMKPYTSPLAKAVLIGGLFFYAFLAWKFALRFYLGEGLIWLGTWVMS